MKTTKMLMAATATGVLLAGLTTSPALAWHPKGVIVKYVQNQTQGGQLSDANDKAHAVASKPGDTLRYVVEVRNDGATDSKGYNDMTKTVMTDTLPTGVELVSDPSKRVVTENLGTIRPGQKITKEYLVKVTSTKDGDHISNKACFTGDTAVNDNPQKGCDVADVLVKVPVTPPKPTPTPTPTPPATTPPAETPAPVAPAATLPETGMGNFIAPSLLASITGYGAYFVRLKRKALRQN